MPIQIGEHLLATAQAYVEEEDDGDTLVSEVGAFNERRLNGCTQLLTIIDDETRRSVFLPLILRDG